MTMRKHRIAALAVVALLSIALPQSRATAQANSCEGTAWTAASEAELTTAIDCWEAATEPGDYSITLAARNPGTTVSISSKAADFTLTLDGAGNQLNGLEITGPPDTDITELSSFTIHDIELWGVTTTVTNARADFADVLLVARDEPPIELSHSDVRLLRVQSVSLSPLTALQSRVLIEDSVLEVDFPDPGNMRPPQLSADDGAFRLQQSAVIVRNSIVRRYAGLFDQMDRSEILFDRSAVVDNDASSLAIFSNDCCDDSTISYVNSTFARHDATAPTTIGIGAREYRGSIDGVEHALVQVANSTIIDNGPFGLIGPVQTWSSYVDRCDMPSPDGDLPAGPRFEGAPVDNGGNVGGCFGTSNLNRHPLGDYGCAVPTPAGCVPTSATASANPARAAGACDDTIIATATDLFDISLDDLRPGADSALTTTGAQLLDGRGFARTSCDSGAYESDGNEPGRPDTLRVSTLDLNHLSAPSLDTGTIETAEAIAAESIDVMFVQQVTQDTSGVEIIDHTVEALSDIGINMLTDDAPAFAHDGSSTTTGQVILSKHPIAERGAVAVPNPMPDGVDSVIQYVVIETSEEPIRLVNVRGHDEAPCSFIGALGAWLADQPPLTTIVGGNLTADRPLGCVGEFAASWVDACATAEADPSCSNTIETDAASPSEQVTNDFLLHRAVEGSTLSVSGVRVLPDNAATWSNHLAVVADYSFTGATVADTDDDGVNDAVDNCPTVENAAQGDGDGDGVGYDCDPVLDGDANCDGTRDIIDALMIAQFDASVRGGVDTCPLGDPTSELYVYGADANNDGTTDIIDALLMAQCLAGITNTACPPPAD